MLPYHENRSLYSFLQYQFEEMPSLHLTLYQQEISKNYAILKESFQSDVVPYEGNRLMRGTFNFS